MKIVEIINIIKAIFSSILALALIAATGIFILFQTFDTDQYLQPITKKASLALGRPVSIGHVGLGLSSRGITLDVWPLIIADDRNFTSQPFVKIDRVRIRLDLKALVLHQEIRVTGILLQSPQVHFIRSEEGNINVHSVAQAGQAVVNKIVVALPSAAGPAAVPAAAGPSSGVAGGVVKRFSVPFKPPRFFFDSIKIQDGAISFIDQTQDRPLDIWLSDINASLNGFSLSKPFRLSFEASLYSNEPNVQGSTLVSLDLAKHAVLFSNLSLHIDLSHPDIERLKGISPSMPDNSIFENITGIMQLNMAAFNITTSGDITASGDLIITKGLIKDFSIVKMVLSRVPVSFGGMDEYVAKLGADTVIDKADTKFALHDKAVFIDNSSIKTNIFELTANGSVDQGLNMDMQTTLHLNADISAGLINQFGGLKYLCDDSQRITVGGSLKGAIPHLKYKPNKDFKKKSKKAINAMFGQLFGA